MIKINRQFIIISLIVVSVAVVILVWVFAKKPSADTIVSRRDPFLNISGVITLSSKQALPGMVVVIHAKASVTDAYGSYNITLTKQDFANADGSYNFSLPIQFFDNNTRTQYQVVGQFEQPRLVAPSGYLPVMASYASTSFESSVININYDFELEAVR